MAVNVSNYKGLKIVDNAQNSVGQNLTNNFKVLVDNLPKSNIAVNAPTVNADTSAGYDVLSKWLDTTTNRIYHCVDPKVGAAQWVQQNDLDAENNPTLSTELNCGNYAIKGNVSSDTTMSLFTVAGNVDIRKSTDFQGRSLQEVDTISFVGGHTITANEIRIEPIWSAYPEQGKVKLGLIRLPNRPAFKGASLSTLASNGDTQWGCLPVGTVVPWVSTNVPKWALLCDGSAVSRTVYAKLFEVIGTNFGAGDGFSTFNLPNLDGKTPIGKDMEDNMTNGWGQMVTSYTGELTHALTEEQIPSHTHTVLANNAGVGCYPNVRGSATPVAMFSTCSGSSGTCAGAGHNNLPPYQTVLYIILIGA